MYKQYLGYHALILKSFPGVMTARGCAYAGSKGVVWGPIKNMFYL